MRTIIRHLQNLKQRLRRNPATLFISSLAKTTSTFACTRWRNPLFLLTSLVIFLWIALMGNHVPRKETGFRKFQLEFRTGRNVQSNTEAKYVSSNGSRHDGIYRPTTTMTRKLPQCIIIGVRKGGTRALLDFLNLHPRVKSAGKEMHYFDDDLYYEQGLDWYKSQMPLSGSEDITIEKTPKYFVTREVPLRIFRMNPKVKLILILRDPIQRTISDYAQLKKRGKGPDTDFNHAAIRNTTGEVNLKFSAIYYSLYYVHLERWLKYFSMDQMLVLNSENFVKEPLTVLRKIERFLNLEAYLNEVHFYFNKTKGFYCVNGRQRTRKRGCFGQSKGLDHPDVSDDVIAKLRTFFQPFNQVLFETIGERFDW